MHVVVVVTHARVRPLGMRTKSVAKSSRITRIAYLERTDNKNVSLWHIM